MSPTEALNLDCFAGNPAPVVYLNGMLLFVAAVAILQAHNRWTLGWPVLITLSGWVLAAGGLYRMIAPRAAQIGPGPAADAVFALLFTVGMVLTWNGYRRPAAPSASDG